MTPEPSPPRPVGAAAVTLAPDLSAFRASAWVASARWEAAQDPDAPPGHVEFGGRWLPIGVMDPDGGMVEHDTRYSNTTGLPKRVITPEQADKLTATALNRHTWPEGTRFGTFKETPVPQRYRKKPVEIEAMLLPVGATPAQGIAVYQWIESHIGSTHPAGNEPGYSPDGTGVTIDPEDGHMVIRTLEGDMKVTPGDWVVRGVRGEFYPCRGDIFEATYEEAPAAPPSEGKDNT